MALLEDALLLVNKESNTFGVSGGLKPNNRLRFETNPIKLFMNL